MLLHEGSLFWPKTVPPILYEKPLCMRHVYDVAIVGAGMSGALCAHQLQQAGYTVALIDSHEPASNSTAANTGLLQYANDIMLHELAEKIGVVDAVTFYKRCVQAMRDLQKLAGQLHRDVDFIERPSVCYASTKEDAKKLEREYDMLQHHGFRCEFWTKKQVQQHMGFKKHAALVTYGDAEVNPVKFVHAILQKLIDDGLHVFSNTHVHNIQHGDTITLETTTGTIRAKHVVYAVGYSPLPVDHLIGANIRRSYALVTQATTAPFWHERALIWETARPYLYLRTTVDNRLVIGGLDEAFSKPTTSPRKRTKQAKKLLQEVKKLFPHLQLQAEFVYCASFGESRDALPYIGPHPDYANEFYIAGYGGNGTVYSMIAADEITQQLQQHYTAISAIVSTKRVTGIQTI